MSYYIDEETTDAHLLDSMRDLNPARGHLGKEPQPPIQPAETSDEAVFSEGVDQFFQDFKDCIHGRDPKFIATEMCERVLELISSGHFVVRRNGGKAMDKSNYIKASVQLDKMLRFIWDDSAKGTMNSLRVKIFSVLYARDFPEFDAILGNVTQSEFARTIVTDYTPAIDDHEGKKLKQEAHIALTRWLAHAKKNCKPKTLTKAAINNSVLYAQQHFGWGPRGDQRKIEARENMKEARIEQLN